MTARITLALLFIIPAAMAYPWRSTTSQWVLGAAVVAVIILFAWWRGDFVTTLIGRRLSMWFRRKARRRSRHSSMEYTTVLLRLDPSTPTELPVGLVAAYVDRYGIRCDKVRITSRDFDGARSTWVGLTIGAADNLGPLLARSPRIPLRDTAEVAGRRLADHLREAGWAVTIVGAAEAPGSVSAKETWRGLRDESGYVAGYRIAVDDRLAETLTAIRASASDTWTALEVTADGLVSASCAVRSADRPAATTSIPAVTPLHGRHRPALNALSPLAVDRLECTPMPFPEIATLRWQVDAELASRT